MALKGHWLDDGSVFLLQASNTLDDMLTLNILPRILLLSLLGVFITLSSCDKEEDPTGPADASVIYFSGQTGQTNGIVAQVADPDQGTTTSVYGTYDATGAPATITSFRVARAGTDTVVTLVIDPVTNNFDRAIFERNGQRLNYLITFDFPTGDTSMVLNHYEYDWATGEHELIYAGEFYRSQGTAGERPVQLRLNGTQDFITNLGALGVGVGVGIGVAELALAAAPTLIGGSSLVGTAVGAVATAVVAVSSTTLLTVVAVGVTLAVLTNDAGASELTPNTGAPQGTPTSNATAEEPPVNPPTPNPCIENRVRVNVGVDPGNMLVAFAQGGDNGPYTFYWSNGQSGAGIVSHSIQASQEGVYTATAVDGNGCAGSGSAYVGPELTLMQKLTQWGPWRSADDLIGDNEEPGFYVFTFSGLDCICFRIDYYIYTSGSEYEEYSSASSCIMEITAPNVLGFDYPTCPYAGDPMDAEGIITILSVTPDAMSLDADGGEGLIQCTPF
jgi:hypothetical protein